MTSTSNPDLKIFKRPSQEDFEPSNISPFNPSPDLDIPSSNLAFDSYPSTSLFSGNNRILINNSNRTESTARFNEGIPQNRSRTSFSIAKRQGRASRRFANGGINLSSLNRDISVFTEATLEEEFKEEGFEGTSAAATPTSGTNSLKRTSKRKSNSNMSIINPFAKEGDEEEIDLFEDRKKIEKEKRKSRGKIIVEKILESMTMNIVVGIVTIFALFADDVRALVGLWILDWVFDVVTIITFVIFSMEIGFSLYVEEGYLWSMFFWLDIFSTASLIFDVEFLIEDVIPDQANHSTQVAEASRASRIATKQGRVIRIIRLAQLGKLYKQINKNKVENIQKEFAAQKEANFLRQQTMNFQRQTTFLNKQKSLAKIHPEPFRPASRSVNERHLEIKGPETKRLLAKTDEIIFETTNLDQTTPVIRKGRKVMTFRYQTQPLELHGDVKESGILAYRRPGTSLFSMGLRKDQGEEVISQPFNRKGTIKSTLLGSKNSGINLTKVISKENNIITEQDQSDITISQPFDRKRTLFGRNDSGINLSKIPSKDQKPKKISSGDLKESKTLKWQMSDRSETGNKNEEGMAELAPKELRIGRRLTELTTKRVVFMSLALLIIIPLCNADFYFSGSESQEYEMELLGELIDDSAVASGTVDLAIENFVAELSSHHHEPRLVYLKIGTVEYYKDEHLDLEHVKSSGTSTVTIMTKNKGEVTSIMSIEDEEKIEAWLSIGKIIFICGLLTIFAVLFSKDTDRMILRPLERIVVKMNRLARDPLQAKKHDLITGSYEGFENETIKIENAIVKIGHLLAIGYGELGSKIITHNVSSVEDISSSFQIGEKQAAIFGFCKINDFVEITEALQEDVVIFVNSVADIVHSMVDVYQGSISKNLGDAFFVVWKFPEEDVFDHMNGQIEILNSEQTESLVDCALFSFLKIFAKIHRDPMLNEYKKNELLGIKIPNFQTNISLALHAGWAYEGAIGSEYKIDASYFSSDVQIVARLTAAAKKYKVPLVITGSVYLLLSEKVKKYARLIDTVLVKEATEPMDLYTIDVDLEGIEMSEDQRKIEKKLKKKKQEKKKKYIKGVVNVGNISSFLTQDTEIEYMLLRKYDEKFVEMFDSAMDSYIEGEWKISHDRLLKCLEMKGGDGPSLSLINFIEKKHSFVVPEDFQGYRDFKDI